MCGNVSHEAPLLMPCYLTSSNIVTCACPLGYDSQSKIHQQSIKQSAPCFTNVQLNASLYDITHCTGIVTPSKNYRLRIFSEVCFFNNCQCWTVIVIVEWNSMTVMLVEYLCPCSWRWTPLSWNICLASIPYTSNFHVWQVAPPPYTQASIRATSSGSVMLNDMCIWDLP